MTLALSVLIAGIAVGAYYSLVTLALQFTYSGTRILNFAQGDMAAAGGLCYWWLTQSSHIDPWLALLLVTVGGFVVGGALAGVLAPFFGRPQMVAGVATIALSFIIQGVLEQLFGPTTEVPTGALQGPGWEIGSLVIARQDAVLVGGAIVLVVGLVSFFRFTKLGLLVRANAESNDGIRVCGVHDQLTYIVVLGLSGAISGCAGALVAPIIGAGYASGPAVLLIAFTAACLGGLGSVSAAAVGALVLSVISEAVAVSPVASYQNTALFGILAVTLLVRPQGLAQRFVQVRR